MVNFVRFGLTASMTWRQFSTVASKNSFGEILRVQGVPKLGVVGAGDIDAAAGADGFGDGATLDDVVEILLALRGVGIEHVLPGADLGDHDVLRREGLFDGLLTRGIADGDVGTVCSAVAEAAVFLREFGGVVGA